METDIDIDTDTDTEKMPDGVGVYAKLGFETNYKLLPLTLDILSTMKTGEPLTIKSSQSELVITSDSKTFQLRQKNHSNTLLLMQNLPKDGKLVGLANFNSELELKQSTGSIDYSTVPIFNGDLKKFVLQNQDTDSVEALLQKSPISSKEFHLQWIEINGSEIDGKAVLLSQDFVTEVLSIVINTVIAHQIDPTGLISITDLYKLIDDDENVITMDVINTVLLKFSIDATYNDVDFKLDLSKISTWYGIHSLKLFASDRNLPVDEFLIKWRSTLPASLSTSLDLSNLKGYYYLPYPELVRYINKSTLPSDPVSRFKNLFLLQKSWQIEDIEPFIKDLNVKKLKASSFIMKYARVKNQGGRSVVTSR